MGSFVGTLLLTFIFNQYASAYFLHESCTRDRIRSEMIHDAIAGALIKAQLVIDTFRKDKNNPHDYDDDIKQLKDWIFGENRPQVQNVGEVIPGTYDGRGILLFGSDWDVLENYMDMVFAGDNDHPASSLRQFEQGVLPSVTGNPATDKDLWGTMIYCEASPALIEVRNDPNNPENPKGKLSSLREYPEIKWYGDGVKNCNYFSNAVAYHVRDHPGTNGRRSAIFICPWYLQVAGAVNIKSSERFFGALKKPLQSLSILARKLGGTLVTASKADIDAVALFDRILFHELTHTWDGGRSKDLKYGTGKDADVRPGDGTAFPGSYGWPNARLISDSGQGPLNADSLAIYAFAVDLIVNRNMQIGPNGEVTGRTPPQKAKRHLLLRSDGPSVETLSWDENYDVFVKALGEIGIDESEVEKMLNSTSSQVRV